MPPKILQPASVQKYPIRLVADLTGNEYVLVLDSDADDAPLLRVPYKAATGGGSLFKTFDFDPVILGAVQAATLTAEFPSTVVTDSSIGSLNNGTSPIVSVGGVVRHYEALSINGVVGGTLGVDVVNSYSYFVLFFNDGSVTPQQFINGSPPDYTGVVLVISTFGWLAVQLKGSDPNNNPTSNGQFADPAHTSIYLGNGQVTFEGNNIDLDLSVFHDCMMLVTNSLQAQGDTPIQTFTFTNNLQAQSRTETPIPTDANDGDLLRIIGNGTVLGRQLKIGDRGFLYDQKTALEVFYKPITKDDFFGAALTNDYRDLGHKPTAAAGIIVDITANTIGVDFSRIPDIEFMTQQQDGVRQLAFDHADAGDAATQQIAAAATAQLRTDMTNYTDGQASGYYQLAKQYTDQAVTAILKDCGSFVLPNVVDVDGNSQWPESGGTGDGGSIKEGNLFFIEGSGKLGGKEYNTGDTIRALQDNPHQDSNKWAGSEGNLGFTPENKANKAVDFGAPDDVTYPTTRLTKTTIDQGDQNTLAAAQGLVNTLTSTVSTGFSIVGSALSNTNSAVSAGLSAVNSSMSSLSSGLSDTNSTISSGMSNTNAAVSAVSTGLGNTNSAVSSGLSQVNSSISATNSSLSNTNSSISSGLSAVNSSLSNTNSSISSGLSQVNSSISSTNSSISSGLSQVNSSLSSTNSTVSSNLSAVNSSISATNSSISSGLSTTNAAVSAISSGMPVAAVLVQKSASYSVLVADNGNIFFDANQSTYTLPTIASIAAAMGSSTRAWWVEVWNVGSVVGAYSNIVLQGADKLDLATTAYPVNQGNGVRIYCDGSNFYSCTTRTPHALQDSATIATRPTVANYRNTSYLGQAGWSVVGMGATWVSQSLNNIINLGGTANSSYDIGLGVSNVTGNSSVSSGGNVAIGWLAQAGNLNGSDTSTAVGYSAQANYRCSMAFGRNATTSIESEYVLGGRMYTRTNQRRVVLTVDCTAASTDYILTAEGSGSAAATNQILCPASSTVTFSGVVHIRQSGAAGNNVGAFKVEGTMTRQASGNVSLVSSTVAAHGGITNPTGWTVSLVADTTNQALTIKFNMGTTVMSLRAATLLTYLQTTFT